MSQLHAHERFAFDEAASVQRLVRLMAICRACHDAIHYGRSTATGRQDAALAQLARVNGVSLAQARAHANAAVDDWKRRSQLDWTVDLRLLEAVGDADTALVVPPQLREPLRTFIATRLPALAAALPVGARIVELLVHQHDVPADTSRVSGRVDDVVLEVLVDRRVPPGDLHARITFVT